MGVDARGFPGGLLRLDPAFAYVEPPSSWPLPWAEYLKLAPNSFNKQSMTYFATNTQHNTTQSSNQPTAWTRNWQPHQHLNFTEEMELPRSQMLTNLTMCLSSYLAYHVLASSLSKSRKRQLEECRGCFNIAHTSPQILPSDSSLNHLCRMTESWNFHKQICLYPWL